MDIDNIIKSVVNQYNWPPKVISKMYCDDFDFKGLYYWYKEAKEISDNIENAQKK